MSDATQIIDLATGWKLRRTDEGDDTWLPVEKVPTVVHLDLLNNKRYATLPDELPNCLSLTGVLLGFLIHLLVPTSLT